MASTREAPSDSSSVSVRIGEYVSGEAGGGGGGGGGGLPAQVTVTFSRHMGHIGCKRAIITALQLGSADGLDGIDEDTLAVYIIAKSDEHRIRCTFEELSARRVACFLACLALSVLCSPDFLLLVLKSLVHQSVSVCRYLTASCSLLLGWCARCFSAGVLAASRLLCSLLLGWCARCFSAGVLAASRLVCSLLLGWCQNGRN
jgi:hypothetical protein